MAEDLQGLLERIRQDGVEKAEAEARDIVAAAQERAKTLISEAEAQAERTAKAAAAEAEALVAHGVKSLEQAGRNVVLSLAESVQQTLQRVVALDTREAMSSSVVADMILRVVDAYASGLPDETRLDILLSEDDREKLSEEFLSTFAARVKSGTKIRGDRSVASGFRVSVVDQKLEHDFSADAIAEALCGLLRPKLAEIIKISSASFSGGKHA